MDGASYTFDLQRIFFGDHPLTLILEIVLRTTVMFVYLLVNLRFLGARGLGQLSLFELSLIIALGSAVGDPMFYADIPLLHGFVVITMVVILQRILISITNRNQAVEKALEGVPCRIVHDGMFDIDGLKKASLSHDELFMELRLKGAEHLGQVMRAYLEPNGSFSVYLYDHKHIRPGLPLFPLWDTDLPEPIRTGDTIAGHHSYACLHCGHTQEMREGDRVPPCPRCQHDKWTRAYRRTVTEA